MSISRRKLITTGLAAAAGASGLAVAAKLADRYGLIPPLRSQIQDPQIIQRLRIGWPSQQSCLKMLERASCILRLRENHGQTIVRLGIGAIHRKSALKVLASLVPLLELPMRTAEIHQRDQMIRADLQGLPEKSDRLLRFPRAR